MGGELVFRCFRALAPVQRSLFAIDFVVLVVARGLFLRSVGRGEPGGSSLSFASPKESNQRKGDPQSGALRATCEMGRNRGSAQTRLRLRQRAALIPISAHFTGPARTGFGRNSDSDSDSDLWFCSFSLGEKAGMRAPRTRTPTRQPRSGWACAERQKRDQGCALSEPQASLRRPPLLTWSAGCPEGVLDCGSPFFWVLFFGEAKTKCLARRGETRSAALKQWKAKYAACGAQQKRGRLSWVAFALAKQKKVTSRRAPPGQQHRHKQKWPIDSNRYSPGTLHVDSQKHPSILRRLAHPA